VETKIEGGKLFIDGKEIKLKNDNGILKSKVYAIVEKDLIVSAGNLHIDGDFIEGLTLEQFNELKENAE
jgi:hypothetical protein